MYFEDFAWMGMILIGVVGAFFGLMCLIGLVFIQGDFRDVEGIGNGCYIVTEYHQNWYPSNNEITAQYTECGEQNIESE